MLKGDPNVHTVTINDHDLSPNPGDDEIHAYRQECLSGDFGGIFERNDRSGSRFPYILVYDRSYFF